MDGEVARPLLLALFFILLIFSWPSPYPYPT